MMRDWLPDAIVLDLQLPRTDGWELTREIKSDPRTRHIAIVVVSACVLPAERAAAEEAGCDAFINKPCDPMWIVDELRRRTRGAQKLSVSAADHFVAARTAATISSTRSSARHGIQRRLRQDRSTVIKDDVDQVPDRERRSCGAAALRPSGRRRTD